MMWLELVYSGEIVTQSLYQTSFFTNPEKSAYDEFILSSPGVSLISGVRSYAYSASRLNPSWWQTFSLDFRVLF